ncbi:MAG: oxaloacetate decarboxylase [Halanaeroarchaeum sp.]
MSSNTREDLADLIARDEIAVLPGSFNALSANIVEKVGFDAVYLSGAGVSNARLGIADVGLTTQTEMADQIGYVAQSVDIPILSDADTGYGNPVNVRRTVQLYEQAGAAGLHIEDQDFPKQCGHFDDKSIVEPEEVVQKVRAAVDARDDSSFVVVARTDARESLGIDEAIRRSNMYADAGADMIFPEAPLDTDEMRRYATEIDAPIMANMVEYGKTPLLSAAELEEIGYDLVIFPNSLLRPPSTSRKREIPRRLSTTSRASTSATS